MLRKGLLVLSESPLAKRVVTGTKLTRSVSRRFVPGESHESLLAAAREANRQGLRVTANYLGEHVVDRPTATAAADAYLELIEGIEREELRAGVSLKFTQMGQGIDADFLRENLGRVLDRATRSGTFVRFDMEDSARTQATLDAFEELWSDGRRDIGVVLQAYLHRTARDVERMIELGASVRLCKGAYDEPAAVAYKDMDRIRQNFEELMHRLLAEGTRPAIATHDEYLVDATRERAARDNVSPARFEFQMLYGVRRDLQEELVADGYDVRVYIPFGEMWYPYLMRRLAERPENVLFMAGSVVRESPLGFLWPGSRRRDGRGSNGAA